MQPGYNDIRHNIPFADFGFNFNNPSPDLDEILGEVAYDVDRSMSQGLRPNEEIWFIIPGIGQGAKGLFQLAGKALGRQAAKIIRIEAAPIVARNITAEMAGSEAGLYDLGTTLGQYVGQSKDIMRRITSHFAIGGKLNAGELESAVYHSMPGMIDDVIRTFDLSR